MNREERRAAAAAQAASEAGKVLQAAGQAVEPEAEVQRPAPKLDDTRQRMLEGMYEGRKKAAAKITDPADLPPGLPPEEPVKSEDELAEEAAVKKASIAREEATAKARKAEAEKKVEKVEKVESPDETKVEPVADVPRETITTTSKQKVDGVEYDVPLAEIEEAGGEKVWRLNKAAENRLAKANEATAETRKMQAQVAAWMEANKPKAPPAPSTDQLFQKLAANRFGTDEEFAANFREVLSAAIPKVDENSVMMKVTASIKRDQAHAKFSKDFNDVMSNPLLKELATSMEGKAIAPYVQNNQINWAGLSQLDWDNFYSTIGTQVRSVVGPRLSQPPATPAGEGASDSPSTLSEKEARKASIVNPPQAAAARAVAPKEEKPETREEALNRMKRSRGIPTG